MARFSNDDWQLLREEVCHDGFFQLIRFHYRHALFKGGYSPDIAREIFVRGDATCVLLYDPTKNAIVLVEQFRAGGVKHGASPWMLELVAGINEEGEAPEEVARREALEEANARVLELVPMYSFYPSPGGSTEKIDLFLGLVDASELGGIHGLEEEGEDIQVHVVGFSDALDMLKAGEIDNAPAIVAIQWLQLNKDNIDERWGREAFA